ncbi:MAG: type II secretion system protein [Candidatus Levybacteria bacterium]|nr:type II secretion system protein [Candidatus Levybacteria bacterium]
MHVFLSKKQKREAGFTLIELLIVIGILGILMTTTLVAINPLRQIAQAKNTKRKSDAVALLNALQQYTADHEGNLPVVISTTAVPISKTGVDLCVGLVPIYVAGLPIDPELGGGIVRFIDCSTTYDTGYTISKNGSQVTVAAPLAEYEEVISYTR